MSTRARRTRSSTDTPRGGSAVEVASALDLLDEGFAVFDRNLELYAYNARLVDLLQLPESLCRVGTPLADYLLLSAERDEDSDEVVRARARARLEALDDSESEGFDHESHGSTLQLRLRRAHDGGAILTCRDVSSVRETERALRHSEERIALIAAAAEEGIYEWFIQADEIYLSPRLDAFFKFEQGELGSKEWKWDDRIHPDDIAVYRASLEESFASGAESWECEYRFRDKDGEYRWIMDHGHILRDEDGSAVRLAGAIRDITSRKQAEEALRESEERYALAMQGIDEGVYDWDIANDSIYYSPGVAKLLGLSPGDLRTVKDWLDRVHPDDFDSYRDALVSHFKSGEERFACDYRYRGADGEWYWARQHGLTLRDESGRAVRMIGSTGDITEHKHTEEALRRSEERYALATRAATEGIYEWTIESNSLFLSGRAQEVLGFPSEPLTPEVWNDHVHPEDFPAYKQALVDHFKGDTDHLEIEYRIHTHGGVLWILDRGIAVRDENGHAIRLLGAITDITARKQAEQELREARDQAEAATRAKSHFLANMSHELRTPLNAIIGFTRLVMRRTKDTLDAKQHENLGKILVSAEHLLSLINTILDLSKIEAERMQTHATEFRLEPLLEHCLRTVEPLVNPDNVELVKSVQEGMPSLHTDQDKLRQLLINLLGNAVKFTRQGSIRVCAVCDDGAQVSIQVADTGTGMDEQALEHIFEEFYQVDSSSTRQHAGTGLGLAIGKRLAELLGGDIHVESQVGVGSTFTVTLPLRYRGEAADEEVSA